MLLVSNFDTEKSGWTFIDKDGDAATWVNVSDKYHHRPDWYTFSGDNALMSLGAEGVDGETDNYAVSPAFTVPADGGVLSWWVAPTEGSGEGNAYELSIVAADEYSADKLGTYPVEFSQEVDPEDVNFKENVLDLAEYAGKEIRLVYRHKSADKHNGIVLDDVYAYTNAKWNRITNSAVDMVWNDADVVEVRYYTPAGVRVSEPANGLFIQQVVLRDGSIRVKKVAIR